MPTSDESLATLTEDWIVTRIQSLSVFATVEPYPGQSVPNASLLPEVLLEGNRDTYACVQFEGDRVTQLEEGHQRHEAIYGVYMVIRNEREGASRRGDGETIGTNKLRDLLRNLFREAFPAQQANGWFTDRLTWGGLQLLWHHKNVFVWRVEVVVEESIAA